MMFNKLFKEGNQLVTYTFIVALMLTLVLSSGLASSYPDQICYLLSSGPMCLGNNTISGVGFNLSQGEIAYSWGDHSLMGYLTAEVDPVFNAVYASINNSIASKAAVTYCNGSQVLQNVTSTGGECAEVASGVDLGGALWANGSRELTSNWDVGSFNISADSFIGSVNASDITNPPWVTSVTPAHGHDQSLNTSSYVIFKDANISSGLNVSGHFFADYEPSVGAGPTYYSLNVSDRKIIHPVDQGDGGVVYTRIYGAYNPQPNKLCKWTLQGWNGDGWFDCNYDEKNNYTTGIAVDNGSVTHTLTMTINGMSNIVTTFNEIPNNQSTTTLAAANVSAGTFGAGNYTMPSNLSITGGYISMNAAKWKTGNFEANGNFSGMCYNGTNTFVGSSFNLTLAGC